MNIRNNKPFWRQSGWRREKILSIIVRGLILLFCAVILWVTSFVIASIDSPQAWISFSILALVIVGFCVAAMFGARSPSIRYLMEDKELLLSIGNQCVRISYDQIQEAKLVCADEISDEMDHARKVYEYPNLGPVVMHSTKPCKVVRILFKDHCWPDLVIAPENMECFIEELTARLAGAESEQKV